MALLNVGAAYWQARHAWSFLRHAYRCGRQHYAACMAGEQHERNLTHWPRSHAVAYAVAQVRPRHASYRTRQAYR